MIQCTRELQQLSSSVAFRYWITLYCCCIYSSAVLDLFRVMDPFKNYFNTYFDVYFACTESWIYYTTIFSVRKEDCFPPVIPGKINKHPKIILCTWCSGLSTSYNLFAWRANPYVFHFQETNRLWCRPRLEYCSLPPLPHTICILLC